MYLLAINCGSSSIKGKLYALPSSRTDTNADADLQQAASLSVSNIGSKGDKVKLQVKWAKGHEGNDVEDEGDDGAAAQYESLVPSLLDKLVAGGVKKDEVKYVVHRVVHGGTHDRGIKITKDHTEGLEEMDKLSEFAPLHNHHAVLAVRSCLDALPNHTSLLVFDTLFHHTIPPETYTYALPRPSTPTVMPLRKYGFHGLSYASIVRSLARKLHKPADKINIVVAHLGSGASACCIKGGKSIDTSMGLSPLEGLIGGTRSGTVDPTTIFHLLDNPAEVVDKSGVDVTKGELLLNKQCGLQALAGTTNFGHIIERLDASAASSKDEHGTAVLAYSVYLDRLMGYVSQYLFKLLSTTPMDDIDGIVFSGGIGERAVRLRRDALQKFGWMGCEVDPVKNEQTHGEVREITRVGSRLVGWVVETDEEGWCAHLAREEFDI